MTRGVLGIGLSSLFSDWGHEAGTSVLPVFLATLGAPPFVLGVIEGVSDGLSSFAKLAGGWLADRPHWRKPVAVAGYVATGLSTFAYAFAHSWPMVLLFRALGWTGRGGRGPAKNSLLADSVAPHQLGRAFGFERAMDTLGAVFGPLSAAALVGFLSIRSTLKWTLVPGLAAALAFFLLVPAGKRPEHHQSVSFFASLRQFPPQFRHYLIGVFVFGLGDFAHTLLILRAVQILSPHYGPVRAGAMAVALYTFHNVVYAVVSYPVGVLADRIGKRGLLGAGYLISAAMCVGFIFSPPRILALGGLFLLGGAYFAIEDTLENAMTADLLPPEIRGTGFGVLATANGVGDFVSSIAVGFLWSSVSPGAGFLYAALFSLLGAILILRWR